MIFFYNLQYYGPTAKNKAIIMGGIHCQYRVEAPSLDEAFRIIDKAHFPNNHKPLAGKSYLAQGRGEGTPKIGKRVRLKEPHRGYDGKDYIFGKIAEKVGPGFWGIHLNGYNDLHNKPVCPLRLYPEDRYPIENEAGELATRK